MIKVASAPLIRKALMYVVFLRVIAVSLSLGALSSVNAQTADELLSHVKEAQANESLDTPDLKPWHLKLAVQQFDDHGKPTEQGTIEEFWGSPNRRKIIYDFPTFKGTELIADGEIYRSVGMEGTPESLLQLINLWMHPIRETKFESIKPALKKQKFGSVSLDCIVLDKRFKGVDGPRMDLYPTFCFEPGKSSVRLALLPGAEGFLRNGVGRFQGRDIPTDFTLEQASVKIVSAKVTTLATFASEEADFEPSPDLQANANGPNHVSAAVMAGLRVYSVPPTYPPLAKQRRIQGTVVLRAIIQRDGTIGSLHSIGNPDPTLADAAIETVKQWKYKPYLLNGQPTEVETTISVNFFLQ